MMNNGVVSNLNAPRQSRVWRDARLSFDRASLVTRRIPDDLACSRPPRSSRLVARPTIARPPELGPDNRSPIQFATGR